MKVSDILARSEGTRFSLEVYPPKVARTATGPPIQQHLSDIFETIEHLIDFDPAFISVTYNPEGKTRATSIPLAAIIKQRFNVESVAHLTCIATPRKEINRTLDVLNYFDIENVLALRGDRPKDMAPGAATGLEHACELVTEIVKHEGKFCIGVAGHPEGHPECLVSGDKRSLDNDIGHFKEKVDQGASFAITQMFLDNKAYFEFVDRAVKAGVTIPIIPGIMPIINLDIIKVAKGICGASVPPALERKLEAHKDDPKEIWNLGIDHAIHQCRGLMDKVPCIHFYTMDLWKPTKAIIDGLK
jgi:methylenetetrahydrofolate reductase (NADPH)